MKKKVLVVGTGICILFALFLLREWRIGMQHSVRIFGEENFAVVQVDTDRSVFFGNKETKRKAVLLRSIQSYFFRKEPIFISQQEVETVMDGGDFTLARIAENITRGTFEDTVIWFFGDILPEEYTQLKETPLSLESDFWILETNTFPDFFPLPSQAILHINERRPSQKLETFAIEKEIPLVTVKETGGLLLEREGDDWEIKTR